jgi:hypothetical protein
MRPQHERALQIAQRDGLIATPGSNGFWVVQRPGPVRRGHAPYHAVKVLPGQLECDCVASRFGVICSHRGVVHAAILAER